MKRGTLRQLAVWKHREVCWSCSRSWCLGLLQLCQALVLCNLPLSSPCSDPEVPRGSGEGLSTKYSLFSFRDTDVHTVASLLKLYLRDLPEPVVPWSQYEGFLLCGQLMNADEAKVGVSLADCLT